MSLASSRARRATAKAVNYAKEQNFSDAEDIFEEEEKEEPVVTSSRRRGRPRKSSNDFAPNEDATMMDADAGAEYLPPKPIYTEKGYDPTLPPLRERFDFMPEHELDGSPRIEMIVGRRPVDDKNVESSEEEEVYLSSEDEESDDGRAGKRRGGGKSGTPKKKAKKKNTNRKVSHQKAEQNHHRNDHVEYEYLIKYKGRSYLHLDWKTGADLESMGKSAKVLYRRYLKKLAAGVDDELEDPNFDPSFAEPQKIVDEKEQEVTLELTDKELVEWEKEREKALAEEEAEREADQVAIEGVDDEEEGEEEGKAPEKTKNENEEKKEEEQTDDPFGDGDVDLGSIPIETLRKLVSKDGSFYPTFEGCDNPYRDGYITEPPKKPRASYLIFQCATRSYFTKRNPDAGLTEIMTTLGETWRNMTEEQQAVYVQVAREEAQQYDKERALMEKAQRPNEMWQPLRRCLMVLDRLAADSFASIFLEPVDLTEFTDYEEIIDQPMDLGTIRKKLKEKKYLAPENFARDVRKVWNNCKIYNQHGSAIWFVADYMSKQFERLYHAWVLEFRERYLRWAHPRARPWEHTCRQCDGKCGTPDDKMVLCDHCDAMYGIACLKPPLSKAPEGIWHCPDCEPKLHTVKGVRMYSAVAEQAARRRADLGDIPKKTVKQTMYLVKWAGLGYEFCTWETKEDINDDALIAEYHRLNNMIVDEPPLKSEDIDLYLEKVEHISTRNAGGSACIPELRALLYAQSHAFNFSKFGCDPPEKLCLECGPRTKAASELKADKSSVHNEECVSNPISHPREVIECVNDMLYQASRALPHPQAKAHPSLPRPLTGEYDAVIPITSKGLMMNVGEINGSVSFLGYRAFPDGKKGPAEQQNLIRNVGDKIIAVDGVSTIDLSFKDVIVLLRESGKNKFAYMRFLENKYAVCRHELTSVGIKGRYAVEELHRKFSGDRRRLLVQRRQKMLGDDEHVDEESDKSVAPQVSSDEDSEEEGSEGEFEPDSEDEELIHKQKSSEELESNGPPLSEGLVVAAPTDPPETVSTFQADDAVQGPPERSSGALLEMSSKGPAEVICGSEPLTADLRRDTATSSPSKSLKKAERLIRVHQETTRSLAYRLLDMDIGYSSDEGGDEDCAFFMDGVDATFTSADAGDGIPIEGARGHKVTATTRTKGKATKSEKHEDRDGDESCMLPSKRNEFGSLGIRAKLVAAVSLTDRNPKVEDFENFPLLSSKAIKAKEMAEAAAKAKAEGIENALPETKDNEVISPTKSRRSTVKVEQVSTSSGEVIRVWANAETAAATLQLPLNEIRQMLKGEYDEELGDEIGGFRWRFALAGAEVTKSATDSSTRGSKKGKEAFLEFREKLYDPADPHTYKNGNRLRDYQIDGVNWLAGAWYKRHSCILADEMGLGKTVQIVCYIEHLFRVEKIRRPYLVVVPLSTVEHWRREFEGWTNLVCCVYHDRQRIWRDVMREYEWYFEDRPHTAEYLKFDVMVTTYDTLISDFDVVGQIPWRVAVVDEAHRLRNTKGKLLECMREIGAKGNLQYGFQSRILMTGTPLQNNTQELWSLLNFIEPYKFSSLEEFQASFGNMANRDQVEALQRKISPFMLRRVKEDVAKDIPAKEETVIDVELTSIQKQYYRAIFEHNHAFLSMGATRLNAPKLMNIQMELRKCCNHPFLLEGVEQRETEKQFNDFVTRGDFEGVSAEERQLMLNEHGYIKTSGKMVLLDKLLPKLRQEGHKILIFSQMVRMLDLISEYCDFRGFRHERLDGRVRGNERQKAIDRFETDKEIFVFLLSTRAGGVGINLTAADVCIIFDSDWNPQNDVQAQARCHRIGQTKDVRIYRLITSRSFEQEMFDRASKKLGLEHAVLGTFGQDNDDDKPSSKEMEELLKKGAYALLDDDEDDVGKQFVSDDIDSILAKRTRTRVVEGAKTASWLNKQGMVVSKSKFTGDTTAANVDVDDPLFWQKVMPDFVTPAIMSTKLDELIELIEGTAPRRGRGRWRKKRVKPKFSDDEDEADETEEKEKEQGEEESTAASQEKSAKLSRAGRRKVAKFMSDLKSLMEGIFEEADDDSLPQSEKAICQKILLTMSVKEKIFNEEQRKLARNMLKQLEGDRRRRCRTSMDQPVLMSAGSPEAGSAIREELLILSKHQKRKRRKRQEAKQKTSDDEKKGTYVGEDGYLHHTDSEEDWSDVGEDIYQSKKRNGISDKEARRRRAWASGDDAATAAGRPWPVFPRHVVTKVLSTLLDEVIKYDQSKGGMFSEPVSRDELPEYYEIIKQPMDYGTMKRKLENGEYRSAQAMQKDFVLVMQNCLQFNEKNSDIVMEARQQALLRPGMLREAAMKHNLFIAEDGSVLEVYTEDDPNKAGDDEEEEEEDGKSKKKPRRKRKREDDPVGDEEKETKIPRKATKGPTKKASPTEGENTAKNDGENAEEDSAVSSRKRPRIKISLTKSGPDDSAKKTTRKRKRKIKQETGETKEEEGPQADDEKTPAPKRKRKKVDKTPTNSQGGGKSSKSKRKARKTAAADSKANAKVGHSGHDDALETSDSKQDERGACYLDVGLFKRERETLDGNYESTRAYLTKRGPWQLPVEVEDKFEVIAKATLNKMARHDKFSVFAEAVTEEEAPGYYETVENPMDFGTMRTKVEAGDYGSGSDAVAAFYRDFLLVFDNCTLYNEDGSEVGVEAARLFGLLPETFAASCAAETANR